MTGIQDVLFGDPDPEPAVKALTIRQPWASLIMAGIKDVENRSKPTRFRGTIAVHAGQGVSAEGMAAHGHLADSYPAGAIIGTVDIVDCVRDSGSEWAMDGHWHWILANPRPCAPVRADGKLSFWTPQPDAWEQVLATLA